MAQELVHAIGIQEAYQYGRLGARFEDISPKGFAVELSEPMRKYAYNLGKMALETQKASEYNKNTTETEAGNNGAGEGLHLRRGVQRTDSEGSGGSVREVVEGTGAVQDRQKETAGRSGNGSKNHGKAQGQVSTKELGVPSGTEDRNLSYADENNAELKEAKALAEQHGLELVAFTGGNLTVNDEDGVFEARAYIYGNRVCIRADHPDFSLMQLLKHEIGHHKIRKDKVDMKKVYDAIVDLASDEYVQYVIESYVNAYASLKGYDADYILEEILCDYEAGMNIFSEENVPDSFWEMSQEILESDAVKQGLVRGPPADGKASRDNKQEVGYGPKGRAEDHASFLRRVHESTRRSRQVGSITYAFYELRVLDASNAATEARRELRRLGIKCFLHNGLEYNLDGYTYQDLGVAATLADGSVAVYGKSYGDGVEYAGHEAFHVWKQTTERDAYVAVLRNNINIASSVHGIKMADTVLNKYFGGDLSALQDTNAKTQFLEELYALVSGQLHSGNHEAALRTMLTDYDSVKAAWDALVESQSHKQTQTGRFSRETSYSEQVDEVKNNTHDPNNHVYMGTTPVGIAKVLDLPKLPMLVTSQHIYSMAVSEQQARVEGRYRSHTNYHQLGWDAVKNLPEYINKPVLIVKSTMDKDDARFIVVTAQMDKDGNPIVAAVKPNGIGNYFGIEIPTNFMLSGYGKSSFHNFVAKAKTENRILYANKNSQKNKNTPSVQYADNILSSDYTTNLAEFKKIVKKKFEGTIFENSGLPQYRFSREFVQEQMTEKEKLLEKANRALERENIKLQEDNQYLRELVKLQKTGTGGAKFTKTSVEAAAKMLKAKANAKGDTKALAKLLEDFYSYIATGDDITWESVLEQAGPVVEWLKENVKETFERDKYRKLANQVNRYSLVLSPQSTMRTEKDIGAKTPETIVVSGVRYT